MMHPSNSISWIMWHSLQQIMIQLVLSVSSRQQAEELYRYPVLHMAGRSIRTWRGGTAYPGNPVRSSDNQRAGIFHESQCLWVNDFGNTYIEVDLTEQYMWYYQNGNVIFQSEIVSGLAR